MLTIRFDKLGLAPGDAILDSGCGEGRHACEAYSRSGVVSVAMDLDPKNVEKTAAMLRAMEQENMGARQSWLALAGDCTRLPFEDAFFKAVICSEVLEHVPDARKAVSELARVLHPSGVLAVSVPRFVPEWICWALSDEYHANEGGHIRIFKEKELRGLVESAGMVCVGRHFAHALHAPYWWLKCLVGVRNEKALSVRAYHRFLVWDIMKKPLLTRIPDRALNPVMGKSLVLYFKKA